VTFRTEFYSTTAQVIPILLLTLAVERRFLERVSCQTAATSVWVRIIAVFALLSGEIIALTAVAGAPLPGGGRVIILALGIGVAPIAAGLLNEDISGLQRELNDARERPGWWARLRTARLLLLDHLNSAILVVFLLFTLWVAFIVV